LAPSSPPFEPNKHYRSALYRMPMLAAIVLDSIAPIAVAIARNAIEEVRALSSKRMPMGSTVPLRDRGVAQARLGRAEGMLRSARAFMYETMADTWARTQAGQALTMEQRADILLAAAHAAQVGAEVTDMMFTSGGSSAVYVRHPMERLFRDAQVIRQHGFVAASATKPLPKPCWGWIPICHSFTSDDEKRRSSALPIAFASRHAYLFGRYDACHDRQQPGEVDRFGQQKRGPEARLAIFERTTNTGMGTHDRHGNQTKRALLIDVTKEFQPVHVRHHEVEQDEIGKNG
ncbi:MAG TPA: hypothetical protein VK550_27850, partial [Polyangiaceae bacterium]|nr:hypothetical protein [Polyangiaceae bacterium]